MTTTSFLWHDYETFGRDPTRERPAQFAAIRTDTDLELVEDPIMVYCRQSPDYLPDPESCLIHGVLPQLANCDGVSEWEFAREINTMMSVAGTCSAGYNNIRFDDEFTRQLLFRNLHDPYAREWSNGNSRWDLIDVVRLTRALRPDGIEWPHDSDGNPTNKLELLTDANGISHKNAHDALSDVYATIAIARLIKSKQQKLFNFAFTKRCKAQVLAALSLASKPAVLHVSGMYPSKFAHTSIAMPVGPHPSNTNGVLMFDLRYDPSDIIECSKEEIAERLFTRNTDLADGITRIPVKTVHANRCPVVAPLSVLTEKNADRLQLDVNQALKNREAVLAHSKTITEKLAWVFAARDYPHADDPDLTLYSGTFAGSRDKEIMLQIQDALSCGSSPATTQFDDNRFQTIWFRIKARSHPSLLTSDERREWLELCHNRVHLGTDGFRNYESYNSALIKLRESHHSSSSEKILIQLEHYGKQVEEFSRVL